jgi:hypothetical protein
MVRLSEHTEGVGRLFFRRFRIRFLSWQGILLRYITSCVQNLTCSRKLSRKICAGWKIILCEILYTKHEEEDAIF